MDLKRLGAQVDIQCRIEAGAASYADKTNERVSGALDSTLRRSTPLGRSVNAVTAEDRYCLDAAKSSSVRIN